MESSEAKRSDTDRQNKHIYNSCKAQTHIHIHTHTNDTVILRSSNSAYWQNRQYVCVWYCDCVPIYRSLCTHNKTRFTHAETWHIKSIEMRILVKQQPGNVRRTCVSNEQKNVDDSVWIDDAYSPLEHRSNWLTPRCQCLEITRKDRYTKRLNNIWLFELCCLRFDAVLSWFLKNIISITQSDWFNFVSHMFGFMLAPKQNFLR